MKTRTQLDAAARNNSGENKNTEPPNEERTRIVSAGSTLDQLGIVVQPIVWISLMSVATTGGGLPAGPFGLFGAVEGLSYLGVVGLAALALWPVAGGDDDDDELKRLAPSEKLSLGTLALALMVLIKLITDQGCVPNAKPIFDYSSYVRVCNDPQATPALFFGGK